ncbi:MAG: NUDIX domain-containing protein [bacterium]|nr:NUDIX domain-containing protein [bacterium]
MPVERSAGIIIFKNTPEERKYLVLHSRQAPGSSRPDFWDFSKGILEKGELGIDAARREAEEEIGLANLELIPDFKETVHYFTMRTGKPVPKYVAMFLAEVGDEKIALSEEHDRFEWLSFEDAFKRLTTMKLTLKKADEFLSRKSS